MSADIKTIKALHKKLQTELRSLELVRHRAYQSMTQGERDERARVLHSWRDEANIKAYVSSRLIELMGAENEHPQVMISPPSWRPGTTSLIFSCKDDPANCDAVAASIQARIAEVKELQQHCVQLHTRNYRWSCHKALRPIAAWINKHADWKREQLVRFVKKIGPPVIEEEVTP